MQDPVRVAVTGAAGQIGYCLLFRIASGDLLGPDQPVDPAAARDHRRPWARSRASAMELDDCAFPLLAGIVADRRRRTWPSTTPTSRCSSGSMPRTAGMERADLLEANGAIFTGQGKALDDNAADDVKILVVGNPANTNCLIAMNNAPDIPDRALHGDDPARPQPGHGPAGRQDRHARSTTSPT